MLCSLKESKKVLNGFKFFVFVQVMDKIDESSSSVKGVRLQGFKGFKLNRNHQLLIKPVFKQPNAKQSDRNATKTNSLANSALGNTNQNIPSIKLPSLPDSFSHLCPTSNAPFSEELPLKNQKNLQLDKRLPSVHENNFDDQIKEYSKKMGITETLKTSAVTSPLKANPYSDSTLDTPNLSPPDNSKRKSRYRYVLTMWLDDLLFSAYKLKNVMFCHFQVMYYITYVL